MKILLRDFETGLYLGRGREWTHSPDNARAFRDRFRAGAYRVWHRLPRTCVVAMPNDGSVREHSPGRSRSHPSCGVNRPAMVEAKIELGPGNRLFIRGEGGGLNWQQGQPLRRVDPQTWIWTSHRNGETVVFQLLLNDLVWARGDETMLEPGGRLAVSPDFEWPEIPRVAARSRYPTVLRLQPEEA